MNALRNGIGALADCKVDYAINVNLIMLYMIRANCNNESFYTIYCKYTVMSGVNYLGRLASIRMAG